jgi:hypothetical protein
MIELIQEENYLKIVVTDREELINELTDMANCDTDNIDDIIDELNDFDALSELLEYELCNGGCVILRADEFGMVSPDCFCLTTDWGYVDDEDDTMKLYNVFFDPNYAIHNYIKELVHNGEFVLEKVNFDDSDEVDEDGNRYITYNN